MSDVEPTGEPDAQAAEAEHRIAGALPNFPDLDWDAFEQASELARQDRRTAAPSREPIDDQLEGITRGALGLVAIDHLTEAEADGLSHGTTGRTQS